MENREGTEDGKGRKGSELSRAPTIDDSLPLRGVEQDVRRVAIGVAQYREARHSLNMLRLEQHYDSCESPRAPSRYDNLDKNVWREPRHYLNDSVAVLRRSLALFALSLEEHRDRVVELLARRNPLGLVGVVAQWQQCVELCDGLYNLIDADADLADGSSAVPCAEQLGNILQHGVLLAALLEDAFRKAGVPIELN